MNKLVVDVRSSEFCDTAHKTEIWSRNFFVYFNVFTVHHVQFIIQTNKCTTYIYINNISHYIFKLTIGNESLHQDSNDNGVRIVNFATSKNLVVKSTMFPHRNIHKYTWTSPDGQTHNQTDNVLIDRRWHSSILDVRSFRGADCDTDHYLVVANLGKD